jgi:uncharacterized protein (TIGR03083 family)
VADWERVAAERGALVDLFAGLADDQWAVPSLCPGWTVKHVLAHLVSALDSGFGLRLKAAVAGRGRAPAVIEALTRAYLGRTPEELVATYSAHVDSHFAPPGLGWRSSLTDVMVHRMDVAVPLAIDPHRPPESWRPVLGFLTSGIPMLGSIRSRRPKVSWRTTDLDWSTGSGPEVSGPADAIGITIAGREALLDRLEGAGVPLLEAWARA